MRCSSASHDNSRSAWGREAGGGVRGVQDVRRHLRSRRLRARGRQGSVLRDVLVAGTDDVQRLRAVETLRCRQCKHCERPRFRLRRGTLPGVLHGGSSVRGTRPLGHVQEELLQGLELVNVFGKGLLFCLNKNNRTTRGGENKTETASAATEQERRGAAAGGPLPRNPSTLACGPGGAEKPC